MLISKQRIKNEIDEKFPFLGNYLRYLSIMYSSDERRESEVHFAYNFINHNSSVIDIGANIGAISRFFARKAKVVYSIEPNPELAKSLSDILPGNCVVLDKALSYASGRSELRVPMNKEGYITHPRGTIELQNTFPGREVKKYEVAVSTLDELVQDYEIDDIDFIKIDVEGHEIDVLNGSRKVIEKHQILIITTQVNT
jgi:FkbM family methyltransferase